MRGIATIALLLLATLCASQLYHATWTADAEANLIGGAVGAVYGDNHPVVVRVERSVTEATGSPMYQIELSGNFHKGKLRARYLVFSALASGSYIWDIWASMRPMERGVHRVWFVSTISTDRGSA